MIFGANLEIMKIKKINSNDVLKYFALCFVSVILSQAKIGTLNPFLFAFFFACLFVGLNEKLLTVFTLLAGSLFDFTLQKFLTTLTVVFVGMVVIYVYKFLKKKPVAWVMFVGFFFSLATYIYYHFQDYKHWILFLLLGAVSLYVFISVLQVMFLRRNCFKLTLDESICFLFALATLGLGLAGLEVFNVPIAKFFLAITLLVCVGIGSPMLTYSLVVSFALGVALKDFNLLVVAEFVVLSLLASAFLLPHKVKICFMLVLGEVFVQFCFVGQGEEVFFSLIPIVLACGVFLLLPNKYLHSLSDLVYVKKSEITSRNVINTTRKNIKKRMVDLSDIFLDMQQIHLGMTKKELSKEELVAMLTREVLSTCCKDCIDKNRCNRSLGTDNKSNLEAMVEIAVTKGKLTLLDIPSALTNRCAKVNHLIGLVNRICDEYRQYKGVMADVNNVKILMADQMGAVSKLLLDVGDEIDTNVRFDVARENKIISRLLNLNIQCKEVLIYSDKSNEISVNLVVDASNSYNPMLEKVVGEVLKVSMQITKITPLEESGFNSVMLRKKSKFDCVFGLSSCNKAGNDVCGDSHSIIRLGGNKFLLALCDGMGAGESAHKMSAMTLGLIENFYKAGFDNDIILESVNKLLSVNNQENYATLDCCVLDLENELADFVKVGAPIGFVKRENKIEMVEGFSLPIGALDNIQPTTHKTTISTKDTIIMATDGVVDAFDSNDNLQEFVAGIVSHNPQTIADALLNEALSRYEMNAKDDMTVLVARTYLKS